MIQKLLNIYMQVIGIFVIALFTYGLVVPTLISQKDWVAVCFGVVVGAGAFPIVVAWAWLIFKEIQKTIGEKK